MKLMYTSDPLNWCLLVTGKLKSYFFIKIALENMKKNAEALYHSCPYSGVHQVDRMIFPRQFKFMLPNGEFKYDFSFSSGSKRLLSIDFGFTM